MTSETSIPEEDSSLGLDERIAAAKQLEESEQYQEALAAWYAIVESDRDALDRGTAEHIRGLEQIVHDLSVDELIERGHTLRRRRRFLRALKSYRSALRGLSIGDVRCPKLKELVARTRRSLFKTSIMYVLAVAVIGGAGWLIVRPQLLLHAYKKDLTVFEAKVDVLLDAASPKPFVNIVPEWEALRQRGQMLGSDALSALEDSQVLFEGARVHAARLQLESIEAFVSDAAWDDAEFAIDEYYESFSGIEMARISSLEDEITAFREALATAPQEIERLRELVVQRALVEALAVAQRLQAVPDATIADEALAIAQDLTQQQARHESAMAELDSLMDQNYAAALAVIDQERELASAWDTHSRLDQVHKRLLTKIRAATDAYVEVSDDVESLQGFIDSYPASQEAALAQDRIAQITIAAETHQRQQQQLFAEWKQAREQLDLGVAYARGQQLLKEHRLFAEQQAISVPLQIAVGIAGAGLVVDGETVAVSDESGALIWWYQDWPVSAPTLGGSEFESVEVQRDNRRPWELAQELERHVVWQRQANGPIFGMSMLDQKSSFLVVAGAYLERWLVDGSAVEWRVACDQGAKAPVTQEKPAWARLAIHANSLILVPTVTGLAGLELETGSQVFVSPLASFPESHGVMYSNELLGVEHRVAVRGNQLWHGESGKELQAVERAGSCLAGPLLYESGLDRFLLVGGLDGVVRLIDDTTSTIAFELDVLAADIGLFQRLSQGGVVTVLDGSRVVVLDVDPQRGLSLRWTHSASGSLRFEPRLSADHVIVTAGRRVMALNHQDGMPTHDLELLGDPILAAVPLESGGVVVAIDRGASGSELVAYNWDGHKLWRRTCPSRPTALEVVGEMLMVGTEHGEVMALRP